MRLVGSAGCLLLLASCTGQIGDGDAPAPPVNEACAAVSPGPSPLRRLTRWEYDQTVHDLLGDTSQPARSFVPEAIQFGFDNGALGATLSAVVVEQYEAAANQLAHTAAADLPGLLGCDPAGAAEEACVTAFVDRFGRRAFRRPLTADERSRFLAFFQSTRATQTPALAVEMLVSAVLQSPHFLYRIELGMPDPTAEGVVRLTDYEVASRLSYLFWGSMPDEELFAAAESGALSDSAGIRAQAERMLQDERGARAIRNFFEQWSGARDLDKIERGDPYSPEIAGLQREELGLFADDVVRRQDGRLETLFTSPATFLNDELATFYGLDAPGSTDLVRVELDPERYPGILTRGAPLALLAHPGQPSIVRRGKFLLEQVMCSPPPPPPCNADTSLPPIDPMATAREQLETKTSVEPCKSCHAVINPPGFALDHFDELGRWRDDEHGLSIDTSGQLVGTDAAGPFAGHTELIDRMATSEEARACMVTHWFRYAFGRDATTEDACTVDDVELRFAETDGDMKELLVALTQTDAFLYRKAEGGAQ
ncbi:MAG: DUF1592 domain-containing protein [Myxococcales bacterium]|nr:DUF1592 domain-containing protein [Myxococcales bacterium]